MSFDTTAPDNGAKTMDPAGTTDQVQTDAVIKVGDRRYQSMDEIVTKIKSADGHIEKLEAEREADRILIAELQAKANANSKVDDLLEKLSQGTKDEQTVQASNPAPDHVSADDIIERVKQGITEDAAKQSRAQNMDQSMAAAKSVLGEDYKKLIKAKGLELGMDIGSVDKMAKDSPTAFNRLFLEGKAPSAVQVTTSDTVNNLVNQQQVEQKLNSSGFMKIRSVRGKADEFNRRMKILEDNEG